MEAKIHHLAAVRREVRGHCAREAVALVVEHDPAFDASQKDLVPVLVVDPAGNARAKTALVLHLEDTVRFELVER